MAPNGSTVEASGRKAATIGAVEVAVVSSTRPELRGLGSEEKFTLVERYEQVELLQRWLISYWTRLGGIAFTPGRDDVVRPGHHHPHAGIAR